MRAVTVLAQSWSQDDQPSFLALVQVLPELRKATEISGWELGPDYAHPGVCKQ